MTSTTPDSTPAPAPAEPERTYSEQAAARKLDIPRSRLQSLRAQGRLAVPFRMPTPDRYGYTARTITIRYDADAIDAVAAGQRELLTA